MNTSVWKLLALFSTPFWSLPTVSNPGYGRRCRIMPVIGVLSARATSNCFPVLQYQVWLFHSSNALLGVFLLLLQRFFLSTRWCKLMRVGLIEEICHITLWQYPFCPGLRPPWVGKLIAVILSYTLVGLWHSFHRTYAVIFLPYHPKAVLVVSALAPIRMRRKTSNS